MITLIRTARYDYRVEGYDLYDSYDLVAQNQAETQIDTRSLSKKDFTRYKQIVSSPAMRSMQTAANISEAYSVTDLVREIDYTMAQIMSKEEFIELGGKATTVARMRFFKRLFSNELGESLEDVMARADKLKKKLSSMEDAVLVVSHAFFMKFFEIYCKDPEACKTYDSFRAIYDGSQKAYDFLSGFSIDLR